MMLGLSPWLSLTLVVVVWEVLGIDTGVHEPHLTISALVQAFRALNAAVLLLWVLVGLGYGVARARAPVGPKPAAVAPGTSPAVLPGTAMVDHQHVVAPALLLPADRAVGVVFWTGLLVACVTVDIVARRSRGRLATAGEVVRLISGPPLARALLVAAWTFAGWHLFAH